MWALPVTVGPVPCKRSSSASLSRKPLVRKALLVKRCSQQTNIKRITCFSANNSEAEIPFTFEEPETSRQAIDLGLEFCRKDRWGEALPWFEKALTLPGTGIKRFRDKPPLSSDSEKIAALFNIACCHSRMGDARSGLVALSGCLELGYTDYDQMRKDPDLELLRQDTRFDGLLLRFEEKNSGGLFGLDIGSFFGGKKS